MRKRDILRKMLAPTPSATSPSTPPKPKVGVVMRVVSRLAAVVYPTNASGNNMSVR